MDVTISNKTALVMVLKDLISDIETDSVKLSDAETLEFFKQLDDFTSTKGDWKGSGSFDTKLSGFISDLEEKIEEKEQG